MLHESHTARIVDLCSGAGGPLLGIQQEFAAVGWGFKAVVTHKFPNINSMSEIRSKSGGVIDARLTPIDATAVPGISPVSGPCSTPFTIFSPMKPS